MTGTNGPERPERIDDLVDELAELVGDDDLARRAVDDLRRELVRPFDADLTARHLATMGTAARERQVASTADTIDLRARRIRRGAIGTVVGLVALGTTGGLAAAGQLPAPLQDAVSRVAGVVSIEVPRSTPNVTVEVPATPGTTGETPGATAPGQTGDTPGTTGDTPGATAPGQQGGPDEQGGPGS